jgi:hypothetical protein
MSSPLDGRIRAIAREEVAAYGVQPAVGDANRVTALEATVTSLHDTLLRLEARLDTLEKAAGQADQEARSATRRTRGTSG